MTPLIWKGQAITTLQELVWVISTITDEKEAARFYEIYSYPTPNGDTDLGYVCGYLPHDEMVAKLRLFGVRHPFFGSADEAAHVTSQDAWELGMAFAERLVKDQTGIVEVASEGFLTERKITIRER